ncbi:hypothetical protein QTP88_012462 [Uroleucon formosanum]
MPSYSSIELADLHFIYGLGNGNTRASQREYKNRFPHRRVPAPAMFSRIHQALRERGTFRRSLRESILNVDLKTEILNEVDRDPETKGLYPYHFLRVHGLENADHQRVQFCRWLLHNEVEDCGFLQTVITMHRKIHAWYVNKDSNADLVWMGIIGGVLIGSFLGFPRTVGGNAYLRFLQNELPGLLEDLTLELRRCMMGPHQIFLRQ